MSVGLGLRLAPLGGALLLFAPACSTKSSAGAADSGAGGDGYVGCANDPRADTYVANLQKAGQTGKYTFTLVQAQPVPPAIDANQWTMKIVDSNGAPPAAPNGVGLRLCMPDHGHGSNQTPQFATNPSGTYTVSDVYLFMPGLWQATFAVGTGDLGGACSPASDVGVVVDQAVFSFCIQG